MTREQLSIAGTEPERNKHIDEALFAWLDAQQRKRAAAADEKRHLASLQVRLVDAKIPAYPYTDPDTGKRKTIAPEAKVVLKTKKAQPERKTRGRRGKRDRDEKQDGDDGASKPADAAPPDSPDPFAATRASMREGKREKEGRTLLDEAREDDAALAAGFSVGDRVTWTSQASGVENRKTGAVIAVIAANTRPDQACERMTTKRFVTAAPRDHVSYGVEVDGEIYWPIVDKLKPARGGKGKR